jgi:hypothetical protein
MTFNLDPPERRGLYLKDFDPYVLKDFVAYVLKDFDPYVLKDFVCF